MTGHVLPHRCLVTVGGWDPLERAELSGAHASALPCRLPRNLDSRAFITIGDRVGVNRP